mgnify:CR=1 FL=1
MPSRTPGAGELAPPAESAARLYAAYAKAGGSRRTSSSLEDEARVQQERLRDNGFDIGIADGVVADARVDAIYTHARAALYASVDDAVIRDSTTRPFRVRTTAASRDDYLAHPSAGERLRDDDAKSIAALYSTLRPYVQLVISDGLNANAVNEHLRALLPELRLQPQRRSAPSLGAGLRERIERREMGVGHARLVIGYEEGQV